MTPVPTLLPRCCPSVSLDTGPGSNPPAQPRTRVPDAQALV